MHIYLILQHVIWLRHITHHHAHCIPVLPNPLLRLQTCAPFHR